MNFLKYLVLPLLIFLAIGVLWTMLMGAFLRLFGSHPQMIAVLARSISSVVGTLVIVAIWWVIAYVIFEVLL
jgi:hypothetical protein